MYRLRSILVGVDVNPATGLLSAGSRRAVSRARWLAQIIDAPVTLLHSSAPDDEHPPPAGDGGREALEEALQSLRDRGIDGRLELTEERPWLALTRHVLRTDSDLVIVGKRAEVGADARRFGSVTAKLIRKCPCAVWAVKADAGPRIEVIVAATDLSPVGGRALELAASICEQTKAELHVVHAFSLPLSVQLEGTSARRTHERGERARASADIRTHLDGHGAELHIANTSPVRAIEACVDRLAPDLLVMGTISRAGVPGLLVGNTAERVLWTLDCSLLVVKPADFVCPVQLDAPASPPA
jgi:universal stress protein E